MSSWYPTPKNNDDEPEQSGQSGQSGQSEQSENPWLQDPTRNDERSSQPLPQRWSDEPPVDSGGAGTGTGVAQQPASDNPYADQPLAGPWGDGSPQETVAGGYPVMARTPEEKAEDEQRAQQVLANRKGGAGGGGCLGIFVFALAGTGGIIAAATSFLGSFSPLLS